MQTFIIKSKIFEIGIDEALKISTEQKVSKFDRDILEFEKALGIEDVRNIQKKIFLAPFKGETKATIIVLRNGATVDAQNSMLKLLEEPPKSSRIFLITNNHLSFLPTILSRGKLIEVKEDQEALSGESLEQILEIETIGDGLYLAQNLAKDKDGAIVFLETAILEARDKMLKSLENKEESLRLRELIHNLETTHYDLKNTNTNPRLALENLFLNL